MTSRAIPSDVTSASAFAVQDAHVRSAMLSKAQAAKERADAERRRLQRLDAATAWVASKPGLVDDGKPCPWAVWGALWLRAELGEGNVTVAAVQQFRRRQFDRLAQRGLLPEGTS